MKIEEIAEKLARSLGHGRDKDGNFCRQKPCTCGEAKKQAEVLDLYQRWKYEQTEEFKKLGIAPTVFEG